MGCDPPQPARWNPLHLLLQGANAYELLAVERKKTQSWKGIMYNKCLNLPKTHAVTCTKAHCILPHTATNCNGMVQIHSIYKQCKYLQDWRVPINIVCKGSVTPTLFGELWSNSFPQKGRCEYTWIRKSGPPKNKRTSAQIKVRIQYKWTKNQTKVNKSSGKKAHQRYI